MTEYLRNENPSHNIWSDMRGRVMAEEVQQTTGTALQ